MISKMIRALEKIALETDPDGLCVLESGTVLVGRLGEGAITLAIAPPGKTWNEMTREEMDAISDSW